MSLNQQLNSSESNSAERDLIGMAQASIDRCVDEQPEESASEIVSLDTFAEIIGKVLSCSRRDPSTADHAAQICEIDGLAVAAFPEDAQLGRFRLIRQLGRGGFGIVLLAFDPRLQREVALKLPRPELLAFGKWRKRFIHEARAVASLDHPGVVPVYDIGTVGPVCYIASAYCNGPTLAEWSEESQPVAVRVAAELIVQVADAVQHAHSRGILHRDLKPANILLKLPEAEGVSSVPTPQVTDFGLASRQHLPGKGDPASGLAGTLVYMAPEQTLEDQTSVGTAADIYALGVMLFELVAGRPPFVAEQENMLVEQVRSAPPAELDDVRFDTPRDLVAICAKCLAKEPSERYESAAALARELRRFLAGECVEARSVRHPERVFRWCKRRPAVSILAALLFVALSVGTIVSLQQWRWAEMSLSETRGAVIDLGWAIDDMVFWQDQSAPNGPSQRNELAGRYIALLEKLGDRPDAQPIKAASDCFFARINVFEGKFESARVRFERSISAWHELVRHDPHNMLYRRALARTLHCYGNHLLTIEHRADGMYRFENEKLFGRFDPRNRVDAQILGDYADMLFGKAAALREAKLRGDSARHYTASLDISRRLADAWPSESDYKFRMYQAVARRIAVQPPPKTTQASYDVREEVLCGLGELVQEYVDRDDYRIELAAVASWMAVNGKRYGHSDQVERLLQNAIAALDAVVAKTECPPDAKQRYARLWLREAQLMAENDRFEEASTCADTALLWYEAAHAEHSVTRLLLAHAYGAAGGVYLSCQLDDRAKEAFERSTGLYEQSFGGDMQSRQVYLRHADAWNKLADLYDRSGRTTDAISAFEKAIGVLEQWRGSTPQEPHVAEKLRQLRANVARLKTASISVL